MSIKLIHTGGPYGDETSSYDVKMNCDFTVEEFIQYILSAKCNEWGYIKGKSFKDMVVEYRYGNIVKEGNSYNSLKNKKILSMTASGGWTRMDYRLVVEQ